MNHVPSLYMEFEERIFEGHDHVILSARTQTTLICE